MRLIDADRLNGVIERIFCYPEAYKNVVDAQPTAYDLDAVIQQLEDLRDGAVNMGCCPHTENADMSCERCYMDKAVGIVKSGARL